MKISGSLISYFSNLVKINGGINLAQGIPSFNPPAELIERKKKLSNAKYHQYAPGAGNLLLRNFIDKTYNINKNNNGFIVTNGATEALSLTYTYLAANKQNFNTAAFSPAYESYIHLPKIFGNKFFSIDIDDDVYFDEAILKNFIIDNSIKLFFVASPGNPYGKSIPEKKLKFLIELSEKLDFYLIIDAVYRDIFFTDNPPYIPQGTLNQNIFYINSFSKKFSITGWRIGYVIMNSLHLEKFSYTHDYIGLCAPSLLQQALGEYLSENNFDNYIKNIKETLSSNFNEVSKILKDSEFYVPNHDGGYFIWCKIPDFVKINSLDFGLKLYENYKTAIIPGRHFGIQWDNYIRINLARDYNELNEGIDAVCKLTRTLK